MRGRRTGVCVAPAWWQGSRRRTRSRGLWRGVAGILREGRRCGRSTRTAARFGRVPSPVFAGRPCWVSKLPLGWSPGGGLDDTPEGGETPLPHIRRGRGGEKISTRKRGTGGGGGMLILTFRWGGGGDVDINTFDRGGASVDDGKTEGGRPPTPLSGERGWGEKILTKEGEGGRMGDGRTGVFRPGIPQRPPRRTGAVLTWGGRDGRARGRRAREGVMGE